MALAEPAHEKSATTILMPIADRKPLFNLSDDVATKLNIEFHKDAVDAV